MSKPISPPKRKTFSKDFVASIVVFLVALPLGMGIAIASGLPPALGLITGIVGGIVVGFIQGSPLQVSGPAAGLAVVVWDLVQKYGIEALGAIVLLAGLIQVVAGLLKVGRWFQAVPPSVVYGMLAGIGVLILSSQFHVMVDDSPRQGGLANLATIPESLWKGIVPLDGSVHHMAAAIGLVTLVTLVGWAKLAPRRLQVLPGALVAVVVGTVAANAMALPINYVSVPDSLLGAANWPGGAAFTMLLDPAVIGAAVGMSVIASAETLLCSTAVDKMHDGERTNYDKELFAQGIGNMICGVFGAPPMTGVIVRSSANVQAGGKTRASSIMHGAWLLLLVVLAPFALRLVPVAALAAILVYTGYKLVNVAVIKSLAKHGRSEVGIYAATLVGIVAMNLLAGVLLGLALALGKLLYTFSNLRVRSEHDDEANRTTLHLRGTATFLGLPRLTKALEAVSPDAKVDVRMDELSYVDHACLEALTSWERQRKSQGNGVNVDWSALEARTGIRKIAAESVSAH